jgi:cation transport protein ChaC
MESSYLPTHAAQLPRSRACPTVSANPPWNDFLGLRWVFAYGSLIWNPEIPVVDGHLGRVDGYHRRLCISSTRYRGTQERPGVVLGLDRGGSCLGMAWEVQGEKVSAVLAQLWSREMRNGAYQPRAVKVQLRNGRPVRALCFVARRSHPAYVRLSQDEILARVHRCAGERGANREYLQHTVVALQRHGIEDRNLSRLFALLGSPEADTAQSHHCSL